ncbi:hypothetical protein LRE75_19390 [Streptomyces sp. 372A]
MGEGEKGSRQANGSPEAAPCQRRPPVTDVGEDGEMPPGDLARLLAAVGVLLGSHEASDLVVMPREELERREYAAYGQGWRDAAAQYHQLPGWADGLPGADAGDRTPGQAAVIPFRRRIPPGTREDARRNATDSAGPAPAGAHTGPARPAGDAAAPSAPGLAAPSAPGLADPEPAAPAPAGGPADPAPPETARAEPAAPAPAGGPADSAPPETARPEPAAPGTTRPVPSGAGPTDSAPVGSAAADAARPGPPSRRRPATPPRPPAFAPKSRRSRVPTIPPLPLPRREGRPGGQD